jgi:glucan 1,3-beta-glucosidase
VPTHRDGHPLNGPDYTVPVQLIEKDLAALRALTGCIRTYSTYGVQGDVLPVAAAMGLEVLLGIWIGADEVRNRQEIDAALAAAARYPQAIRAIVVGNEVLLRREMTAQRLAGIINAVKARTAHPVAYADIYEFWRRNPVVAEAADRLLVHVLPYWDDPTPVSIDEVQAHVRTILDDMRAMFPHARIEIGEIGWPSAGRTRGYAVPGRVNQARFVREFTAQAGALGMHYNLIEAIDQPWKRLPEGTVGGYWGILDSDREPKFALTGPVREWPHARAGAIFSMGTCALFLASALLCGRRPRWLSALGIGLVGAATGTCLWMLLRQVPTLTIGVTGQLWGAYLFIIAAAGGMLAGAQLAGLPAAYRRQPACLASVLDGIRERSLSPAQRLGLGQWTILLPAAIVALALAVDGRHRDFLTLAFVLPAIALAIQARYAASRERPHPPELAWITLLLIVSGPLAVDAPGNLEAIAWAATCWLLALPGLPAVATEFARLRHILSAERQAQHG